MALINCEECGKKISDSAERCIHCGIFLEKIIYCKDCGKPLYENDDVCPNCGYDTSNKYVTKKSTQTNNMCVLGFIISCIAYFISVFGITALTGLVLSTIGLGSVKPSENGKGFAIAGIIIGVISLLLAVYRYYEWY